MNSFLSSFALRSVLVAAILVSSFSVCRGQSGTIPVFNVMSYGATGNGTTNDAPAIQNAITAAQSSGGIVYFPAGTYLIKSALQDLNLYRHNLIGSGVNSTFFLIGSGGSFTVSGPGSPPYHNGSLENFSVYCTNGIGGGQTGIITQDAIGLKFHNLTFSNCGTAIDMQNINAWTERNDFDDITFYDNNIAVHFDQNPSDTNTSYDYNSFRIWVNTNQPGTIFQLTDGANATGSFYSVKGNIQPGTTVFDVHSDGYQNIMFSDTFLINLEDQVGSGTSYLFNTVNSGGPNSVVGGIGQLVIGSNTQLTAPGSIDDFVGNVNGMPQDLGTITTTASTSDTFHSLQLTPTSKCIVQPENSTVPLIPLAEVYASSYNYEQLVLNHPAVAGAVYRLWCHQ